MNDCFLCGGTGVLWAWNWKGKPCPRCELDMPDVDEDCDYGRPNASERQESAARDYGRK